MLASRAGLHHTHFNTPPWSSQQPDCKSHVFRKTGWSCEWFQWTLWFHPPWSRVVVPGGWCRRAWAWPGARYRGAADTPSRHHSLQREGGRENNNRTLRTFPAQQKRCHTCSTWCCLPAGREMVQDVHKGRGHSEQLPGIRTEWHCSKAALCLTGLPQHTEFCSFTAQCLSSTQLDFKINQKRGTMQRGVKETCGQDFKRGYVYVTWISAHHLGKWQHLPAPLYTLMKYLDFQISDVIQGVNP